MTKFSPHEVRDALTAIANGTVADCSENKYSVYQYLEERGFIKGDVAGLNRYQRKNLNLTHAGQQQLSSSL